MLKSKNTLKQRQRAVYGSTRKTFNRECQKAKRAYQRKFQDEMDNLESGNNPEFWKKIGKIGVGKERNNQIPMEVVMPCGTVSSEINTVLEVWRKKLQRPA